MSNEKILSAIEEYVAQVDRLLGEVAETKRLVNTMCNTISVPPRYGDVEIPNASSGRAIRADEYYGRAFAVVAKEYLETRRGKGACTAEEITRGLESGGFDFPWKEKDKVRMVAISLAKNSAVFQKLPNNTFGLLSWYPEIKKKNEAARRAGKVGLFQEEDSAPEETAEEGTANKKEENIDT